MPISKSRQEQIDLEQKKVDKFNENSVGTEYRYYPKCDAVDATTRTKYELLKTTEPAFVGTNYVGIVKVTSKQSYVLIAKLDPV